MEARGVAHGIDALAADDIAAGRLVAPFNIRVPVSGAYYLVALEEAADQPVVSLFRDWVLREAAKFLNQLPESITGGKG